MSIAGSKVGRDLDDLYFVMHLDEFASDGRRGASGRDGRRLKRLAKMCENLASRGRSHFGLRLFANLRFEVRRLRRSAELLECQLEWQLEWQGDEPNIAAAGKGTELETPPRLGP